MANPKRTTTGSTERTISANDVITACSHGDYTGWIVSLPEDKGKHQYLVVFDNSRECVGIHHIGDSTLSVKGIDRPIAIFTDQNAADNVVSMGYYSGKKQYSITAAYLDGSHITNLELPYMQDLDRSHRNTNQLDLATRAAVAEAVFQMSDPTLRRNTDAMKDVVNAAIHDYNYMRDNTVTANGSYVDTVSEHRRSSANIMANEEWAASARGHIDRKFLEVSQQECTRLHQEGQSAANGYLDRMVARNELHDMMMKSEYKASLIALQEGFARDLQADKLLGVIGREDKLSQKGCKEYFQQAL